jgi:PAS domain S-box-containing protein
MTWILKGSSGPERLIDYEMELNKFITDSKCIFLCQFSRRDFDLELISVVQHSHPFVILNMEIYENHSFVSPVELTVGNLTTQAIDSWACNLASHQQVEEELDGSCKLAQTLIDGVNSPIMIIDTDRHVRVMNRTARDQYSRELGTLPQFCYQISHNRDTPCSGEEHPCPLEQVLESKGSVSVTHNHFHPNGEKRVVEIVASPLYGSDNTIKGIVETMWDITDQTRATEAYLESEQRFLNIATMAADAIVLADSERNIIFWNRAAQNIFGYGEEEILGKPLTTLISKSQLKNFNNNLRQIQVSSDQEVFGKMLLVSGSRKDGSVFPAEHSISSWRRICKGVLYCRIAWQQLGS